MKLLLWIPGTAVLLVLLSPLAAQPAAQGTAVGGRLETQSSSGTFVARPAADFIDSVGVCAHLGRVNTNYVTRFAELKPLLLALGIRHIRTDPVEAPEAVRNLRELAAAGVKFNLLVHGNSPAFIPSYLALIRRELVDCTESIEGLNEPDSRPEVAKAWLAEMRRVASADPVLAKIPLVGSALAHVITNGAKVGDWSALIDLGNLHAYPGGRAPEASIGEYVMGVRPQYGSTLPYLITETGYHSALHNPANKHRPTAQPAEAIYMPRLYLEYFRLGFVRSYKYQLLDDRTEDDPRITSGKQPVQEAHFGFIDYNFKPKPAYLAVKHLLAILQDPPSARAAPRSLRYEITGPAAEMRHVLLQKSTGELYLAVWRAITVWNQIGRTAVPVSPADVTVRLAEPAPRVRLYRPSDSSIPFATRTDVREVPLVLSGEVVILELSPPRQ